MQKQSSSVKWVVILFTAILFLIFSGALIFISKKKDAVPVKLSSAGQVTGNPKANVTVTEFGDFQCPACKAFEPIMQQLRQDYGNKVKIVYKHFPLTQIHANAMPSARAAQAASLQGKFWQYHDLLYEKQEEWSNLPDSTDKFVEYAKTLKLDIERFQKDMKSKSVQAAIDKEADEGISIGVNATPTVYVNSIKVSVSGYNELKKIIDQALSKNE